MHSRLKKTLKKIWIPHKVIVAGLAVLFAFPVLAASSFQEYCNNPTEKQKKTVWTLFSFKMPGSVDDDCLDCMDCKKLEKILNRSYGVTVVSDLGFLRFFPHMTHISIRHEVDDVDLKQLKHLKNIERLSIDNKAMVDFSVVGELTTLRSLSLDVGAGDFSSFNYLVELRYLILMGEMKTLPKFDQLTNLKVLNLGGGGNRIENIENVQYLTNLETLTLSYNNVTSLKGIESLTSLKKLSSATTKIRDLTPLLGLPNLTELSLSGNPISDLSPLVALKKLRSLHTSIRWLKSCSPKDLKEIKKGVSCQNDFFTNAYIRWFR